MKILVDIGHPAHVHYFRNAMQRMQSEGHSFLVVARDKEVSQQLLKAYGIPFISRGKGARSRVGKLLYMLKADVQILFISLRFRPDVFLSVASPYAAQVAWILRKPHVALDDTENAHFARKFYLPFSAKVITPFCYRVELGLKQVRMRSFFELFYLHPNYRTDSAFIRKKLGVRPDQPFAILRFVSWGATHDYGLKGLTDADKQQVIDRLKPTHAIFISSEGELPDSLRPYRIQLAPHEIHHVLAEADICIGEGATMASECAMLGTPAIYINEMEIGNITTQSEHVSIVQCKGATDLLLELDKFLVEPNRKEQALARMHEYVQTLEDPNPLLISELKSVVRKEM